MGRIHYQLKKRIYRLKAYRRKGFGVHSPFVFYLISNVIEAKLQFYAFAHLSPYRKELAKLLKLKIKAEGLEKNLAKRYKKEIQKMGSAESLDRLQFRLQNFWPTKQPAYFGGGIDFSMLYMAKVDSRIEVAFLDSEANFTQYIDDFYRNIVGVTNFNKLDYNFFTKKKRAFDFLVFSETTKEAVLSDFLQNQALFLAEECMIIVRNLHQNGAIHNFWNQMKKLDRFSVSLDLFHLGILIARKGMQKQDYVRKYRF